MFLIAFQQSSSYSMDGAIMIYDLKIVVIYIQITF